MSKKEETNRIAVEMFRKHVVLGLEELEMLLQANAYQLLSQQNTPKLKEYFEKKETEILEAISEYDVLREMTNTHGE